MRRHVTEAEGLEIDGLAVLLNQHDGAGELAGCDFIFEIITEALQPLGRKTGLLRIAVRIRRDA